MSLIITKTKHLKADKLKQLYKKVNRPNDWKIDVKSHALIDKIIELWFEEQGYDFWDNPYPEVIEWKLSKEKEIIFTYVEQQKS